MKRLILFLLILVATPCLGCECKEAPIDAVSAKRATHVFVFRLTSAKLSSTPQGTNGRPYMAEGNIEIVESIRGNNSKFAQVQFSTYECCGLRFSLGHSYVAFVQGNGPTFRAHGGNILDPGSESYRLGVTDQIKRMLSGRGDPQDFIWQDSFSFLQVIQKPWSSYVCPSAKK